MHTILVLEDDIELNNTICYSLEKNGYRVMGARTCEEAKNYANSYTFHMAILDINLVEFRNSFFPKCKTFFVNIHSYVNCVIIHLMTSICMR